MEEFSEVPGKTRGAGVSALASHLFNAEMEIGKEKLSFFQPKLSEAVVESFACLPPKEVLKTRAAEAHLRGKLPDPLTCAQSHSNTRRALRILGSMAAANKS